MVKYWLKLVIVFLAVGLKFSFIALIKLTYLIKWFQPLVQMCIRDSPSRLFYAQKNKAPLLGALWKYKSAVKNKRVY